MDRTAFIIDKLKAMTLSDLNEITGLDVAPEFEGEANNIAWTVQAVGAGSTRAVILDAFRDIVIEAFEADAVSPRDAATVLPFVENLRRNTRLVDFLVIGAARRVAPLGGEYSLAVEPHTTVTRLIDDIVQEVYDQAAQRLVSYLENEASNNPEVEQ